MIQHCKPDTNQAFSTQLLPGRRNIFFPVSTNLVIDHWVPVLSCAFFRCSVLCACVRACMQQCVYAHACVRQPAINPSYTATEFRLLVENSGAVCGSFGSAARPVLQLTSVRSRHWCNNQNFSALTWPKRTRGHCNEDMARPQCQDRGPSLIPHPTPPHLPTPCV